jgi:ribosomal protein S18
MNADMHIQDKFEFIEDKDIPQMIKWAMKEANPIYPCRCFGTSRSFRRSLRAFVRKKRYDAKRSV